MEAVPRSRFSSLGHDDRADQVKGAGQLNKTRHIEKEKARPRAKEVGSLAAFHNTRAGEPKDGKQPRTFLSGERIGFNPN
jgi:hypothetical protein